MKAADVLSEELSLSRERVDAVLRLLSDGATVPFIARYRKEATGGLDEVQIRAIEERHAYWTELEERRGTVLKEIESQGKLTKELSRAIAACHTKAELEDLYLPFKPKRRTRAAIARERGLEPLADRMWSQPMTPHPRESSEEELAGARDICAERIAENAEIRKRLRDALLRDGVIRVSKKKEHRDRKTKFDTYASYEERLATIPSHRYLAIRRGEAEGVLRAELHVDVEPHLRFIERHVPLKPGSPWAGEVKSAIADALERLVLPSIEADVSAEVKRRSDAAAIDVFAKNLRELLLAAPFGPKAILAIDPGQRTGCKCAVLDETGKLRDHATIHLVQGEAALEKARETLRALLARSSARAVAVGNGTHGRETEAFVREAIGGSGVLCVSVSESGASVYSASDLAREEFPDLDVTVRGAVSIGRRLQDPLAELVKIDPKSIGVGQYQHDVSQPLLAKKLDEVVETCVNAVGVDVNTASAPLLSRVAGIGRSLAKKIVDHRSAKGLFETRDELRNVQGLGPRAFEQAAGFLRIRGGPQPLDASAVHPERYALVERMARDLGVPVASLVGSASAASAIDVKRYQSGDIGSYTLDDIVTELKKPGRDPRASFAPPKFRDDVRTIEDLERDMILEGVVTNVAAFGAFVDVGVHHDGLVHVSELSDRFVKDPADVVKVGDRIQVRVLDVDLERGRISLSARDKMKERRGPQ